MTDEFFSKVVIYPTQLTKKNIDVLSEDDMVAAKRLSVCSNSHARAIVPYNTAKSLQVLPLSIIELGAGQKVLSVATSGSADDIEKIKTLKFCTSFPIKLVPVKEHILQEALFIAYYGDDKALANRVEEAQDIIHDENSNKSFTTNSKCGVAASFLDGLMEYAISHHASDIHFIPTVSGGILRLRIDGELRENREAINTIKLHQQIIARIKVLSKCSISRLYMPFDSSFKLRIDDRLIFIRVSIMPTIHGEKAVLRFLCNGQNYSLEQLNIDVRFCDLLKRFALKGEGAILFSGPTGSGKTSSIYALLKLLREKAKNIITLEDPVEIELKGVSQTSIAEAQGFGFAEGLRSILRQDPDVVMVGEIRDAKAAQIALQAALTGHLLLSTIHTRSVLDIPLRLSHFGVDNSLLAQSLSLLISQRLIPRLCAQCKVIDLHSSKKFNLDVYQPVGCACCDYSGFDTRIVAMEALIINKKIRQGMSLGEIDAESLSKNLTEDNYFSFNKSLFALLKSGLITAEHYNNLLK